MSSDCIYIAIAKAMNRDDDNVPLHENEDFVKKELADLIVTEKARARAIYDELRRLIHQPQPQRSMCCMHACKVNHLYIYIPLYK